ncbi:MAG: hypothetical protein FK731_13510 [Asgard group archaeon]|nr:hypothetical protein [Asgard group archaeon]
MDKKRITLSILIIFILIVSMTPFKMDSIQTDFNKRPSNFTQSTFSEELKDINPLSPIIDNTWNEAENSTINNKFEIKDKSNETTKEFSLENCEDWTLKNNFNFTNIRSEKIINGDAETSDELWTDFLPPQYAGSVSRENNIPNGDVINGEYSWYFNLSTNDYAVIIGFDELFNVSSDSVVFSFSYSLLRNNLGMSYDSNICIRLFFQFDIYIFFWFNGNIGVLSNVTGPGGYADLLVNDSSFDGLNHKYSLNVTDLGLELFNQKPDQLRSLAVQTWGELPSYEMEFLIDDLSLTDQKDPTSIDLSVNTNSVIGDIGNGFVSFIEPPNSKINYDIDYITQEKILFDFGYEFIGTSKIESSRICFFEDWETIEWNESTSIILNRPENVTELKITKSVPIEWTINQICVDGLPQAYEINDFNGTHKNIEFIITSYNNIEFIFYSTNLINNIILSDYQITHNDILIANIESEINNDEISIYILNQNGDVYYKSTNHTNEYGEALITDIQLNSETPRGILSFVAFFNNNDDIGIGKKDFEITTFPTCINPPHTQIKTN